MRLKRVAFPLLLLIAFVTIYYIYIIFLHQARFQNVTDKKPYMKLQVVTSFYPLYYFASTIAGDKAEVRNITPAGVEPHAYEPTSRDIAAIEASDVLILNGIYLEPWGNKIYDTLKAKKTLILRVGDALADQQIKEKGVPVRDPHVWLDPSLAKKEAQNVLEGFIKVDPTHEEYYTLQAHTLFTQLDALNGAYKEGLRQCKKRDIITSHAAFGYLANAYGINQITLTGLSPDEEPSVRQLASVARFAKTHAVRYIFFEKLVSPRLSETIAHEIGAQTLVLDPIEGLTNEDLQHGKNYITTMLENLKNLRIALECT